MGKLLFYLLWPLVWFYAPLRVRVRAIIIVDNKQILVVKNWFGPGAWQLPGGGVKFGEAVIDAASREVNEELGLQLPSSAFTQLTSLPIIVKQFGLLLRYHYVVCKNPPKSLKPQTHHGIQDFTWVGIQSDKPVAQEVDTGRLLL